MIVQLKTDGLDYKANIVAILRTPANPQLGADVAEIERVTPILIKLAEADDEVDLTANEFDLVCDRLVNARFSANDPAILDMVRSICNPMED